MHQLAAADRSTDALLRDCLQQSPAIPSRIMHLERKRLESSTSYDTSIVTVQLEDGRTLRVFMKDFGHSVRPKDQPHLRRERELHFYRDLAPQGELGTPRYFGSVWEPENGRQWLLIEYVQGTPVRYCDFEDWPLATAWLGEMHGCFSSQLQRLESCAFLALHDRDFFRSKAQCSLDTVARIAQAESARLADALRDYDDVVDTMLRGPRTLLHGGYRPMNVLIRIEGDPRRICVIDWEEAGVGSPISDLGYFVDGFEGARLELLLDRYRAAAEPLGLPLPAHDEMLHAIDCFRLHKLVHSLQKYVRWNVPAETIQRLIDEVAARARAVRA